MQSGFPIKKSVGVPRQPSFDQMLERSAWMLQTLHHGIIPNHESKRVKRLVGHPLDVKRPLPSSGRDRG
jgi:hypothetical protein